MLQVVRRIDAQPAGPEAEMFCQHRGDLQCRREERSELDAGTELVAAREFRTTCSTTTLQLVETRKLWIGGFKFDLTRTALETFVKDSVLIHLEPEIAQGAVVVARDLSRSADVSFGTANDCKNAIETLREVDVKFEGAPLSVRRDHTALQRILGQM